MCLSRENPSFIEKIPSRRGKSQLPFIAADRPRGCLLKFVLPVIPFFASWSLVACGDGGTTPTSQTKPTAIINASPAAIASGGSSTLTWSSTAATACTASGGWTGTKTTSGTQTTGALNATTSYSLTCNGPGGSSGVSTATVSVNGAATVALTARPAAVSSGGASTLTWTSTNATSCTASGAWSGAKAPNGSQSTGALTVPTLYSLSCTGPGGASAVSSVTVNVVPLATLTANPSVITSGGTSTLTWSSINATSCTASGGWSGPRATSGTFNTTPLAATTAYSLTCVGPGGTSAIATATVTISDGTVAVSPKIAAITLSRTQQFAATVPGGGAATWSVDGVAGGNAAVGTISATGLYTAGTAAGAHTVLATSVAAPTHSGSAQAAVTDLAGVFTYHNDLARDGANIREYALTAASVNPAGFGKLFTCTADGAIYGQPLWVANLTVNGALHNVVFVATEHDGLFAFDADASPCATLWSANLIDLTHGAAAAGETTVPSGPTGNLVGGGAGDVTPELGVTGTPVIDRISNTLYVVSMSVNAAKTTFYQRLHAIDLTTGKEKAGSPVTITGSYPGFGGGTIAFDPRMEFQRCGLALVNGVVYIAWAGYEDHPPYYGWVMGYSYNGSKFMQSSVLNVTPRLGFGGIWMSGGAIAADSNNFLYALTGNGDLDPTSADYGDSLLQLTPGLAVSQYFTPSNQVPDSTDNDFGAGGAAVLADLPAGSAHPHLVMGGGKSGAIYVLDRDHLGGQLGDTAAVQKIPVNTSIFATGAFWNNTFYIAGLGGPLNAYSLDTSSVLFTLSSASPTTYGFAGATPSVSAAGAQAGIVWALDNRNYCTPQSNQCLPALLHAYDAANVATELWNSSINSADAAGNAVKFTVPTVANGRVYVGTRGNNTGGNFGSTSVSGELDVYGLKP